MDREKNWYSVIQYVPNHFRGEKINIGLILHNPLNGEILHKILPVENSKIRGIADSNVVLNSYKINCELFDEIIKEGEIKYNLFPQDPFDDSLLSSLTEHLPSEIKLTKPKLSLTTDPKQLFDRLLDVYVGTEFFRKESKTVSAKIIVSKTFRSYRLIGTKVKQNVKIFPYRELKKVPFLIDFVYKNGKINLLQTVPSREEQLTDWFSKAKLISETYEKETGLYYLFDSTNNINSDNSISQMICFLQANDNRIQSLDVSSKKFLSLCEQIQKNGKDIHEFEDELQAI